MNICLVSYEYPPETFDGIGTYTRTLAQALAQMGESVDAITFTAGPPCQYDDKGVRVHRINPVMIKGLWRLDPVFPSKIFAYSIAVKNKIRRILAERRIDVIEGPEVKGELFYYLLTRGRDTKPPVVVKLHTPSYLVQKHNFHGISVPERALNFWERQSVVHADRLTAPSAHLKETIARDYRIDPRRITVIPHPVDTEAFTPPAAQATNGSIHVLFAGRIERIKGAETLARAIPEVVKRVGNCSFTFLGNDTNSGADRGSLRRELQEHLRRHHCENKVIFRDRVEKEELISYYQKSDITVVPSFYESLGFVCLEAMACGKAVVASGAGGLAEVVTDRETGLIAPAGDAGSLADGIVQLCKDRALRERLGRQARAFVERRYSRAAAAAKTLEYYKTIVPGEKRQ